MKTRRNTGGFTILELALAVAIIGILSGVTAVNVVHYQRTLTQVELDGIAREIFVAAQNHLTMVESQGFMGVSDSDWGEPYQKGTSTQPAIYYYVVKPNTDHDSLNMLNLMLPFASVDETVRTADGSYVIRYQKDPALVLDVFYAVAEETAKGDTKNRKFAHTFTETEAEPPKEGRAIEDTLWSCSGSAKKGERGQYPPENGTAIIGWYGVEPEWFSVQSGGTPTPVPKAEKPLSPPTIKIVNAEQLYVEVTNPNRVDREKPETLRWYGNARLHLEITGSQSKKSFPIELINNAGFPSDKVYIGVNPDDDQFYPKTYRVILDDVTQEGTRFYEIMASAGLYPGEDIVIRAVAYNNTELTNIATSASATTNSLFASVDGSAAKIANFRHLENLDSAVSRINADNIHITQANQISDMDRNTFMSGAVSIYYGDNNTTAYFPVTNGGKIEDDGTIVYDKQITYNGNEHKISNVTINVPGDAGLFAKLGHSSSVTDLELVNFSVISSDKGDGAAGTLAGVIEDNSTVTNLKVLDCSVQSDSRVQPDGSGAAGGLAGVLNKSTVQSVLVHHEIGKSGVDYKVTGKGSIGGLVGQITGACTVKQSAAAVYVTSTSNKGSAGGLIGTVSGGASATVMDSYAGGHTTEGHYKTGNCNVSAYVNAGGLIGSSLGSLTVENCYATTSASGAYAGGLIGYAIGGSITNCYATGYVTGSTKKGGFVGKVEENPTFSNEPDKICGYFTSLENEAEDKGKAENERLQSVGEGNYIGKIASFYDEKNYSKLSGYPPKGAVPYDDTLGDKYAFQTISELHSGVTSPEWMSTHYGDWPKWNETQVVNELAS